MGTHFSLFIGENVSVPCLWLANYILAFCAVSSGRYEKKVLQPHTLPHVTQPHTLPHATQPHTVLCHLFAQVRIKHLNHRTLATATIYSNLHSGQATSAALPRPEFEWNRWHKSGHFKLHVWSSSNPCNFFCYLLRYLVWLYQIHTRYIFLPPSPFKPFLIPCSSA